MAVFMQKYFKSMYSMCLILYKKRKLWHKIMQLSLPDYCTKHNAYVGPRDLMADANHESSVMWFQPQISQKLDVQTMSTTDVNQFINKRAFHLL